MQWFLAFTLPCAVLAVRPGVSSSRRALALALVIWMFTFEDTAIIVEPAATRDVFVPLATPNP